jgi:hypothetical protein
MSTSAVSSVPTLSKHMAEVRPFSRAELVWAFFWQDCKRAGTRALLFQFGLVLTGWMTILPFSYSDMVEIMGRLVQLLPKV